MKKPTYSHPEFVSNVEIEPISNNKARNSLTLTINEESDETLIVIMKNPSIANKKLSDKTVYTVTKYISQNRNKYKALKNIGKVLILNLIPFYETEPSKLVGLKESIFDPSNFEILNDYCKNHKKVIIAWGNHPKGLLEVYSELRYKALKILKDNKNEIYYVDKFSKLENPKHGQVWGYNDILYPFEILD